MGKFTGVLLATDYDDTLYDRSFTISRENRRAIDYFLREGGLFSIATGRSFINFAIQMEKEHLPVNTPVVLSNGASIYDFSAGKLLWQRSLTERAVPVLEEVCAAFPEVGFEAYHGDEVYTYRANTVTARHLTRCELAGIPRNIGDMPTPWIKVILQHEDTNYLHRVQDFIRANWPEYEVNFSNHVLLELTARGANKGVCVQWIADHLGVQPENIYCVGNGVNDIPMLEISAVPFAPADAYAEVLDWGPTVLPPCGEHTIARLIDFLDERYEKTRHP